MHELSLCQRLIQQVEEIAQQQSATAITKITLQLGPLASVTADHLKSSFTLAAVNTLAQNADLHIDTLKPLIHCNDCEIESETNFGDMCCPTCSSTHVHLLNGDEIQITNIEISQ